MGEWTGRLASGLMVVPSGGVSDKDVVELIIVVVIIAEIDVTMTMKWRVMVMIMIVLLWQHSDIKSDVISIP